MEIKISIRKRYNGIGVESINSNASILVSLN